MDKKKALRLRGIKYKKTILGAWERDFICGRVTKREGDVISVVIYEPWSTGEDAQAIRPLWAQDRIEARAEALQLNGSGDEATTLNLSDQVHCFEDLLRLPWRKVRTLSLHAFQPYCQVPGISIPARYLIQDLCGEGSGQVVSKINEASTAAST